MIRAVSAFILTGFFLQSSMAFGQFTTSDRNLRKFLPNVSEIHWLIAPAIESQKDSLEAKSAAVQKTQQSKTDLSQFPKHVAEKLGMSNNNVAITLHHGRLYAAIRTAAIHHPGKIAIFNHDLSDDESQLFVLSAEIDPKTLVGNFGPTLSKLEWKLELDVVDRLRNHLSPLVFELADEYSQMLEEDFDGEVEALNSFQKFKTIYGDVESEKIVKIVKSVIEKQIFSRQEIYEYLLDKLQPLLWGSDYREPLFLESDGKLYLYIMQVEKAFAFNPLRTWAFSLSDTNYVPHPVLSPKEVLWDIRYRKEDSQYYYSGYRGDHYGTKELNEESGVQIFFRKSKDGFHWTDDKESEIYRGGGSELSFDWNAQGDLFGVMRLDDGDQRGWGSLLTKKTRTSQLFHFPTEADPQRFDSPRMFRMGKELFLLARQNIYQGDETKNAPYDLNFLGDKDKKLSEEERAKLLRDIQLGNRSNKDIALVDEGKDEGIHLGVFVQYEIGQYWHKMAKRTALYWIDQTENKVKLLRNFPSAGDTAFPSIVEIQPGVMLVANYSSPIEKKDIPWQRGQFGPTGIYFMLLDFRKSGVW